MLCRYGLTEISEKLFWGLRSGGGAWQCWLAGCRWWRSDMNSNGGGLVLQRAGSVEPVGDSLLSINGFASTCALFTSLLMPYDSLLYVEHAGYCGVYVGLNATSTGHY